MNDSGGLKKDNHIIIRMPGRHGKNPNILPIEMKRYLPVDRDIGQPDIPASRHSAAGIFMSDQDRPGC